MTKNILRWDIDNGRAREIEEYLKESDAQGRISRLAFTQYSAASFDSWDKDAEFFRRLSTDFSGELFTRQWVNEGEDTCCSARWLNGNIIQNDTPQDVAENRKLMKSILDEIERAEMGNDVGMGMGGIE